MLAPHDAAFMWQAPGTAAPVVAPSTASRGFGAPARVNQALRGNSSAAVDAVSSRGPSVGIVLPTVVVAAAIARTMRPQKRSSRQRSTTMVALAAEESSAPAPRDDSGGPPKMEDNARVALVSQRLMNMEGSLRRWGFIAEVVYTWLGMISLGVAGFAGFSHGAQAYRSPSMALGLASVSVSVLCALVGWFQARSCRRLGRSCGLAASSLEPGGPAPPASQLQTMMPSIAEIESGLKARQRTAWLGAMSAVVGLQAMVGLLVTKVLAAYGGLNPAPGVPMDVFTLLAVSNSALSHVIGGGVASLQLSALPLAQVAPEDPFRGWARQ